MKEQRKTVVDSNTGEILEETTTIVAERKYTKDTFIYLYLNDLSGIMNIKNQTELRVLAWLWKFSSYPDDDVAGNCVVVGDLLFDKIEKDLCLKRQTIKNCISGLAKEQIIIKDPDHRSTYYLNPKYFYKGKIDELPKTRKVILTYTEETNKNE